MVQSSEERVHCTSVVPGSEHGVPMRQKCKELKDCLLFPWYFQIGYHTVRTLMNINEPLLIWWLCHLVKINPESNSGQIWPSSNLSFPRVEYYSPHFPFMLVAWSVSPDPALQPLCPPGSHAARSGHVPYILCVIPLLVRNLGYNFPFLAISTYTSRRKMPRKSSSSSLQRLCVPPSAQLMWCSVVKLTFPQKVTEKKYKDSIRYSVQKRSSASCMVWFYMSAKL